ncbi:hypothetical protein BI308_25640 [Roseofilum reptotaenium AO1-A]|uniref:histidine kinase n=1 Tax=Roseofilum reptotaenium AO1-A TaxID=1925591 RepID=A0A1L9QFJ4_9CYAN|nr:hypothetical protein BI308_25640 [Roseofilum reptotaenium AO1-A]
MGLKFDLEKCQNQWQQRGKIEPFELARTDRSDRFLIPEKLYGRETSVQRLLEAFDRIALGTTEMMLVAGFSGIGKTAVVNEVHKPIVKQRGYFIKGKFDQFNRNIPFSAFVIAFRDLMGQLLAESDAQLAQWKEKTLAALGENGQVIIDVIPELERIIGKQPKVAELSGTAAQNRFNVLFQKFIQVFTTQEHPLVIFVDDLQWADLASLKLMELLMEDSGTGYLLLLGAYRDNEVSPVHSLMLTLDKIANAGATIDTITLAPLSPKNLKCLVADTLSCSLDVAQPLTELIDQKTKGNPFFATQFLKGLHEDEFIVFDRDKGYWFCDITQVRQLALTDDVVEFMASRLHKLPSATQEMLRLAACIGDRFDLETLAIVSEQSRMEVAASLWRGLQEGLVLPLGETYKFFQESETEEKGRAEEISVSYKFLHDRVQQAAYSLIPETQKKVTHLTIGQLLLGNSRTAKPEDKVFDIVNQLNMGRQLISCPEERQELAQLNLKAGQKAKASTAYSGALGYLKIGLELLDSDPWNAQYQLTLDLYTEVVEASYLNGEFEDAQNYSEYVLQNTSNVLDVVKIYELKIGQTFAENKAKEALEIGLENLSRLGISQEDIRAYGQREIVLCDRDDLANSSSMTDPYKLAAMRILVSITSAAAMAKTDLFSSLVATQIHLSLDEGHSSLTASAYGWYGFLLCGYLGDMEKGYHAGQLAIDVLNRFEATFLKCEVRNLVYQMNHSWKEHLRTITPLCLDTFKIGIENGSLIHASYSAGNYFVNMFLIGENLQVMLENYIYINRFRKQVKSTLVITDIWRQLNLNLQGLVQDRFKLAGESINEDSLVPKMLDYGDTWGLFSLLVAKEILLYFLGNYEQSVQCAIQAKEYISAVGGWPPIGVHNFYFSLSLLALYADADPESQQQYLAQIATNQKPMFLWAQSAAMNYQHKYDLVEAERSRITRKRTEAIELYDRAIAGAKDNQYLQEEALANELAAKFYLDWGKEKIATGYMTDAYYCYAHWGAKAKTDQLEETYPQLLSSILQQPLLPLESSLTTTGVMQTARSSSSTTGLMLDWATAMKAAQSLSSEMHLDKLVLTLMKAAMENAGADSGILLLQQLEGWQVVALYSQKSGDLSSSEVLTERSIPTSVINTVKRSQEAIIVNDFSGDIQFAGDPYLLQEQPKSFLCAPILNQGKLIGILYLENHLATEAFTRDRVELLSLLCSQAAISLENARLYEQAQQALKDLQEAQLQLVQSEKMSALGNLVAGVAHEINNPVGFIAGNINPARDYVQDLLGLIDLYQQEYPELNEAIEEEIEAIDLEFLRSDLLQLISSMRSGTDRIRHISNSLRTFSRTDKEYKVPFNLHEGIDSTLLILKHRLKANEKRPAIEIAKEYGDLPEVHCFPGQLNQVFMNLIANAIDALESANEGCSFDEIANQIKIITSATPQEVTINIVDNGTGMPEEVRERIFEQGFTTKAVGKGTGLGMAIAHQIIEEKHGGTIDCYSQISKGTEFMISLPLGNPDVKNYG